MRGRESQIERDTKSKHIYEPMHGTISLVIAHFTMHREG